MAQKGLEDSHETFVRGWGDFACGLRLSARRRSDRRTPGADEGEWQSGADIGRHAEGRPLRSGRCESGAATFADSGAKGPALFPDDSKTGGDTEALPAIWENKADFDARFAKFAKDASAASAAISDEASLKANAPAVFQNCGGCHEKYRAKKS